MLLPVVVLEAGFQVVRALALSVNRRFGALRVPPLPPSCLRQSGGRYAAGFDAGLKPRSNPNNNNNNNSNSSNGNGNSNKSQSNSKNKKQKRNAGVLRFAQNGNFEKGSWG
jgi:hypothetical protein